MKIRIEMDPTCEEMEIVLRTSQLTPQVQQIQEALAKLDRKPLIFYKGTSEFFLPLEEILFFETDGNKIFGHTKDNAYEVRLKLYELEDYLPTSFCRVAKSAIANIRQIYALDKSFSGTSTVQFYQTQKQVHASRHYYQLLKEKLQEMR
ncbi:LytTR family DNA-binding domain-containing protein [Streptococcus gallinaceus]|uniref:DNA-binding LytR/AlgR family response regulator n=1 Tax=Streptococcus gallinaceus TaxID=165758 RepID=A0ABV2JPT3_9STRE|nr:LytTR family DNA-binding domain-containing protein [Streptococcus gallinaceus]MCP1639575.1 DNA-binding LytR/AlgR family response regulator [Streptococcus gallinaceus]MCP1770358.1 DNA-binding LytR/AlgR family response regulator [Streptococcus gallinaceus]